jgi:hypothetical protein
MMRGRQIGNWIGNRESPQSPPEESLVIEHPQTRSVWRWIPVILLLLLILAVAWWMRREGDYRLFISSLRDGKVQSIEFQPYSGSAFVKITEEKRLTGVADWLRDARAPDRRFGVVGAADCQMRITMADGSVKTIWMGQTGPLRSGGTLVQSNAYVLVRGDGWERVAFSGGLSALYLRLPVSDQLPFSSVPPVGPMISPYVAAATAPTNLGEVDPSIAQTLINRGQWGAARRMLARALALNPNDPMAQQFMVDVQARIRIRLPQVIQELERQLPENPPKLDRANYLQLREKLLDATLMAEMGDAKLAELHKRLKLARPQPQLEDFREILRLGGGPADRYGTRDIAWSPDGATIASCGADGRVRIWETLNGELLESFPAAVGDKIYFSDDGRKVWVWNDQSRTWWDVTTGKPTEEGKVADDRRKSFLRFDVVDADVLTIYEAKEGSTRKKVLVGHAGMLKLGKTSPDDDEIVTFAQDKVLSIWGDGAPRGIDELSVYERMRRIKDLAGPAVFLQDGSVLTFAQGGIVLPATPRRVKAAARAERLLVEMEKDALAVVQPDEKKVYPIKKPEGSCGRAAISPDGKNVAVGNLDGSVRLIDAESGQEIASLKCTPTRNRNWAAVEFSADGGWVMACGVGFVSVWNKEGREQIFYTDKAAVEGIAATFTPDGKGMAIIYKDSGLRILKSNLRESEAVGWDQVAQREPTFSSDGRWLAAIDKGGGVSLYNSAGTAGAHIPVSSSTTAADVLQFNDDGSVLLIKSNDSSVRLVEVPSGRELRRLVMREAAWLDLPASFSPDGKSLIAGKILWGVE